MAEDFKVFDWDDEVEAESQFVTLEEGDYPFEIVKFEKGIHRKKEGGKAPDCPMAIVTFEISGSAGSTRRTENYLLYSGMEWKISELFRSVGLKRRGERTKMRWNELTGLKGKCHVTKVKGTGNNADKWYNNISKLYPAEEKADIDKSVEKEAFGW